MYDLTELTATEQENLLSNTRAQHNAFVESLPDSITKYEFTRILYNSDYTNQLSQKEQKHTHQL